MPLDYKQLVAAAKKYHVALEINNSSMTKPHLRLNCLENYHTMLAFCMEYRVPILVSSDAHDPIRVGRFDLAEKILEETGFNEELVLNTDVAKWEQFVGMRQVKTRGRFFRLTLSES